MFSHEEIESLGFTGRLEALRKIKRWKSFAPAFYRHNLEIHTLEILYLFNELEPLIRRTLPDLDIEKTHTLILVHDDPETISRRGDVPYSEKLNMTPAEKRQLEIEESDAINNLVSIYPRNLNGLVYKSLLEEAEGKSTKESQLLSYIDKFSALCESLHELHAGNTDFHKGWQTERARPPVAGNNIMELIPKYTLITPFTHSHHPLNPPYTKPNTKHLLETGKPFTTESIHTPSGLPHYDFWKSTILKHGKQRALEWLTIQKEFL